MAQRKGGKGIRAHKFGDEQFSTHYERDDLRVYTNPSGELFVENTRTGISMRINPGHNGELKFTTNGLVQPVQVNNMIGWLIVHL